MMTAELGWKACYRCLGGVIAEDVVLWCLVQPMRQANHQSHLVPDAQWLNEVHGFINTDAGIRSAETDDFLGYLPPGASVDEQPWGGPTPDKPVATVASKKRSAAKHKAKQ
jgi:hypothetical protein